MNNQYYDHLGCFTFKTSIDSDEIQNSNQENDSTFLNSSSQMFTALKASAIAQYHNEVKKMEKLVSGLQGDLESHRQQTVAKNENPTEVMQLQQELMKLQTDFNYVHEANEEFMKENKDIQSRCSKLEMLYQQSKEVLKHTQFDLQRIQRDYEKKEAQLELMKKEFDKQLAEDRRHRQMQSQKDKDLKEMSKQILATNQEIKNKLIEQQQQHQKELQDQNGLREKQISDLTARLTRYEQAFKRITKIVDPKQQKCDDEAVEQLVQKIQNVIEYQSQQIEGSNQQIKQRMKILAEVISKQDNSFKNTIIRMTEDIEQKDGDMQLMQQQVVTQGRIIADLTQQIEDQRNEFNECCEGIQLMNSECQNLHMQLNILQQEKQNHKSDQKAKEFLIKNLRSLIFSGESMDLIEAVQQCYEKILSIQSILKSVSNSSQMQDRIKQYEHEMQILTHKLNAQLCELQELATLEQQRYNAMTKNEKECLTLARENDFLKHEKELSIRVTRDSVTNSHPSSRAKRSSNPLGKSQDNLNSNQRCRTETSFHQDKSDKPPSHSLLAQFLSMRSQKNLRHQFGPE